jgi:hypothetical protein
MRRSTALMLTAPSFAACVCASTLIYPNILGVFLAPLIFGGIALVIAGLAIASKHHENTPRSVWILLTVAGGAQLLILISLGAFRG